MKITWEIMAGLLKQKFHFEHRGKWNGKREIDNIQIWDGMSLLASQSMYVNISYSLSGLSFEEQSQILTILEDNEEIQLSNGSFIICKKGEKFQVLNQILTIYQNCTEWLYQIERIARQEKNMRKLVNLCTEYLNMSIIIVNSAYEISVCSDKNTRPFRWMDYQTTGGRMTEESIEELYLEGEAFEETFTKKELSKFVITDIDTEVKRISYYYNFMDEEDRYLGRIVFAIKDEEVDKGILTLMNYIAKEAETCFLATMQGAAPTKLSKKLHQTFELLLGEEKISRLEAESVLMENGWKITDGYKILKLISIANVQSVHTLSYYRHLLENNFTNICAIEKNSGIFCLINLAEEENENLFRQNLPYFLRENLFLAGVSCRFESFLDCSVHAKEASYALTMGQNSKNGYWIHEFSEFSFDYCLKKIGEEYPICDLMHPGLEILEKYDKKHPGSDLSITLMHYLNSQYNATHTAQKLHIHRTTFLYRLRRIKELTGISLEEEKTRLHLQLSYALKNTD